MTRRAELGLIDDLTVADMGDEARWAEIEDGVRYLVAAGIVGPAATRDVMRLARKWGARPGDVDVMLTAAAESGQYPRPVDLSFVAYLGPRAETVRCRVCGKPGPVEAVDEHEVECSRAGAGRVVGAVASVAVSEFDWSAAHLAARRLEDSAPAGVAAAAGEVASAVGRLLGVLDAAAELRELRARVDVLVAEVEGVGGRA